MAVQPSSPFEHLSGELITPDHPSYDAARRVWNGMIDKRPALIVRCANAADVAAAIAYARDAGLPLAVRGGGHNVAGTAVVDGGLVVDLSPMRAVHVDLARGTVHVQGGATWADVDRVTAPLGLAAPGGVVSETGVAGLALSGGVSWQRRRDGMTVDNLVSAQVVLADGSVVRAAADEHSDLLWALRGGGGNFGVVTSFELKLHELGVSGMYAGDPAEGERAMAALRTLATPLLDMSGTVPYLDLQSSLDAYFPAGLRYYWKALYLDSLSDGAIDATVSWSDVRADQTLVIIRHCGGAISRVDAEATAFGDRSSEWMLSIDATWADPADDERNIAWTRDFWDDAHRFSSDGKMYFNFPGLLEEGDALIESSYGANTDRLAQVKPRYDAGNVFQLNQNIRPAD